MTPKFIKFSGILNSQLWNSIVERITNDVDISEVELNVMTPEKFNDGFCDFFAEVILEDDIHAEYMSTDDIPEAVKYPNHAWVRINDKHYDIEALNGVDKWENLPIFVRWRNMFLQTEISLKHIYESIYNRTEMPQVSGEDLGDAYKLMKEKGIPVEIVKELPKNLKHSQKEIHKNKVVNIIKDIRRKKKMPPLVISKDKWIVDGHHRQVAYQIESPEEERTMIQIGYNRDKAIEIYKKIEELI